MIFRIFGGWYSWKQKSYTAADLDLKPSEYNARQNKFEVRQKCLHICGIPFISLGKMYIARENGKIYQAPPNVIETIKAKGRIKTPWYTFTLLIIGALLLAPFPVIELIDTIESNTQNRKEIETKINELEKKLNNLGNNDFIYLNKSEHPDNNVKYFMKVHDVQGNTVSYSLFTKMHKVYSNKNLHRWVKIYYNAYKNQHDTNYIHINKLKSAVPPSYNAYKKQSPTFGIKLFKKSPKLIIDDIVTIQGPIICLVGGNINKKAIRFYYRMYLEDATLVGVESTNTNIKWNKNWPRKIILKNEEAYFTIDGTINKRNTPYEFKLIFEDKHGIKHSYLVNGKKEHSTMHYLHKNL